MRIIHFLAHDEEGATLVEYGLLLGLTAMVALAGVSVFGTSVSSLFTAVGGSI
jgi:pilus assembly protein Flp/PilA